MTLMLFELKRNRLSLAVWTAAIALLLLVCLAIFPDMKGQVNELNAAFSSMGSFTEAFGMDQLNFGELMGFYGLECGNILGIGSLMAFPGSMIGAFCCGMVYAKWKKLAPTCVAEALGTGILGGIAAYPVAEFLMGAGPAGLFVYVVPFLISTVAGSILAFVLITVLSKGGVLNQLKTA